ncbi:uncharacterized protein LOC117147079 [Drosophila mauritiana]|uniref:Uncharacterized protein LOC117147079 n=1 Tax=Drosophila mauritiana TaxID=7226 RepID=A0A6P8KKY8_DROMA|nr:uncharacterized protein LOC117147079 [Drosophila mauritiana]
MTSWRNRKRLWKKILARLAHQLPASPSESNEVLKRSNLSWKDKYFNQVRAAAVRAKARAQEAKNKPTVDANAAAVNVPKPEEIPRRITRSMTKKLPLDKPEHV